MSKHKLSNPKIVLVLICLVFLFTRLYKIREIPLSVYWDEASIGYNAYSIAETGRDEWGKFLPIHLRAFGELKLPVYIYSVVPFVKLFGLNEFSVRMPAVLFSLGVIILIFLLAKKLTDNVIAGLFSSFFISISPWFFIFSRTGYEATAGLMFYILAIYLFLKTKENNWYVLFSSISFILSTYSYNSFRIIVPFTILLLIFYEIKNVVIIIKKNTIMIALSLIILVLSIIPIYRLYVYDAGISRLQAVGATNVTFIKNYLSHFSLNFLLLRGDNNLRSQQSGFGELYLPELILIPLGFLYLIKSKLKYKFLVIALMLLGPIPAAITREAPHALRAIATIPFIYIISATGIIFLKKEIKQKYLIELLVTVIFLAFFAYYFINFINIYPIQSSKDWQAGYKMIFTDFKEDFPKYDQVIVSDEYAQPYIFALFYQKFNPYKFRQTVVRNNVDQWGFSTVSSFDKFKFGKVDKLLSVNLKQTIIFASKEEALSTLTQLGTIKFLDGNTAFWVYKQ